MELRSGTVIPSASPTEQDEYFREGVRLLLQRWTALQLAVEHQWGGWKSAEKYRQLEQEIILWFYRKGGDKDSYILEEMLDRYLLDHYNAQVEDGSLQEVSDALIDVFQACLDGNFGVVIELQEKAKQGIGGAAKSQKAPGTDEDWQDDNDDEMNPSNSGLIPTLDPLRDDGAMDIDLNENNKIIKEDILTAEEVADGWQMATPKGRKSRR